MQEEEIRVLIMAAGTGGHIFPALAIADRLRHRGAEVHWLGTPRGMEQKLLSGSGIPLHVISASGLKDKGWRRLLVAPLMLLRSLFQSLAIMARVRPNCVLGMGGYVSGPGGIAARLTGRRLVIHEQNAVAGFTNRRLAGFAHRVLEAFPNTFPSHYAAIVTGNPVRGEISALSRSNRQGAHSRQSLRLLILGGSQGAKAINEIVPQLISNWQEHVELHTWHQCGEFDFEHSKARYEESGIQQGGRHRLTAFIEDMAAAYDWADLVLCRSGASTVFELAAAGLPSILVPYPHHSDRQQEKNGQWLVSGSAAHMVTQDKLTEAVVHKILLEFATDRASLQRLANHARDMANPESADVIARHCLEVALGH